MSISFDLVINCDIREDVPDDVIAGLKCLTTKGYELKVHPQFMHPNMGNVWEMIPDKHFLAPDPEREIMSQFQRKYRTSIPKENHREVYRYSLQYIARHIHDDVYGDNHRPFLFWLETVVHDKCFGYIKSEFSEPELLIADPNAPHLRVDENSKYGNNSHLGRG